MKYLIKTVVLLLLIIGSTTHAQELSFDLSGQINQGENSDDFGTGIAFGANYNVTPNLSINSGLGVNLMYIRKELTTYSGSHQAIDEEGETFDFQYTVSNYTERNRLIALNIPLTFQYETLGDTRFFVRVGGSYTVPVTAKTNAEASSATTSGFFERFNATITEPRFAGFGQFDDINFKQQDADFKGSVNLLFETGIGALRQNNSNKFLYLSVFAEIGLNNFNEKSTNGLLTYNPQNPTEFITTSILNVNDDSINDSTKLVLAGIRLRVDL